MIDNIKRNDKKINKNKYGNNDNDNNNDKKKLNKINYSDDMSIRNNITSNDKSFNISQIKFNQTESNKSLFTKVSNNNSKINKNNISTSTSIIHNINFEIIADNDNNKNIN